MQTKVFSLPSIAYMLVGLAPLTFAALDPSCAPGGNFDMSYWSLQLPIPDSNNDPQTESSASLQGCGGFENFDYFFTESGDGAMVMKVPGGPDSTSCVTTPNSEHCRTELREVNPDDGSPASWDPNDETNSLRATLIVTAADDGSHGTVIGQIHIDDDVSSKPVCELYYSSSGDIVMGVETSRDGGDQDYTTLGNVPLNTQFSYGIDYAGGQLTAFINNDSPIPLSTDGLNTPPSYFKAGNYNQGEVPSDIHFLALTIEH